MNDANPIFLEPEDLLEVERFPRLDLSVDFVRYYWTAAKDGPALATVLELRGKPTFGAAIVGFMEERSLEVRREHCPNFQLHFARSAVIVAIGVMHDPNHGATHLFLLDEEAMLGRLNSGRRWQDCMPGQLLALLKRFGARCLPGLLTFANDPVHGSFVAARVLRTVAAPEVAPVMARALLDPHARGEALRWLDKHRHVAEAALTKLLGGSLGAIAYLDRGEPVALDARLSAIARQPSVAAFLAETLGERSERVTPAVDLGDFIDTTGASDDARLRYGESRRLRRDADASAVERDDIRRLFAPLGSADAASVEAFLREMGDDEGITVRTIDDLGSGVRYVAYLHGFGGNTGGYVVRDDEAHRAVVAEVCDTALIYEPGEGAVWP